MRAWVAGLVAFSFVAVGCGGDKSTGNNKSPAFSCDKVQPVGFPTTTEGVEEGNTLPDEDFVDTLGNTRCTHDFTGQVTFISIGTGWCPPCQAETPGFVEVYDEYKDQGFEILQVMFEDYDGGSPDEQFMQEWRAEYGIEHILVPDPQAEFFSQFLSSNNTGPYVPHNIMLDKDGVITYTAPGSMPENTLRARVMALIDDEPVLDYESVEQP